MANRVLIKLNYNKKVLIDVKDLPKLMEILDGATLVEYNWVGEARVDYIMEVGFKLEFEDAPAVLYKTEQQYRDMAEAYGEAEDA